MPALLAAVTELLRLDDDALTLERRNAARDTIEARATEIILHRDKVGGPTCVHIASHVGRMPWHCWVVEGYDTAMNKAIDANPTGAWSAMCRSNSQTFPAAIKAASNVSSLFDVNWADSVDRAFEHARTKASSHKHRKAGKHRKDGKHRKSGNAARDAASAARKKARRGGLLPANTTEH
jgi:hypothetical protein